MNLRGFFSDLFQPKVKTKAKEPARKAGTTREAAEAALKVIFSTNRSPRK